jgi:ABC-type phosphate transport system auxiliary subunit
MLTPPRRYSSIRHTHITEDIKKTISIKQTGITAAIVTTDKQMAKVENNLEDLRLTNTGKESVLNTEDKDNALEQIRGERTALDCSRKLLQELLLKIRDELIPRATSESQDRSPIVTFGNTNNGFQIGVSNGPISGISFGVKDA